MKIAILIEDLYHVLEAWYPFLRLREEGIDSEMVGSGRRKEYHSKDGYMAQAAISIKDINIDEYDGVIIPGGYAPDYLRRYPEINHFVKEMNQRGKLVAAICHGGWVLASAGVLKDRKATGFFAIKDDLKNAGCEFIDQEVVIDNNLITSRTPYDLPAFMKEILNFLKK